MLHLDFFPPLLNKRLWHDTDTNLIFCSNLSLADHSKSRLLTLRSITLDSYFSGSDLMTCKITLRLVESVLMLISLLFTVPCPVSLLPLFIMTYAMTHEQRPISHSSPLNNTCQARSGSEEQGKLWGFENCSRWITASKEFPWSCATKHLAKAWQAVKTNLHMQSSYCSLISELLNPARWNLCVFILQNVL